MAAHIQTASENRATVSVASKTLFNEAVREVLRMIFAGAPLNDVLLGVTRLIEAQGDRILCSIWLLDKTGNRLKCAAAPSLPPEYIKGMEETLIGPEVTVCGPAVYGGESPLIGDVYCDFLWENLRPLAKRFGLQSCWSTSIVSHEGHILGSFAMYYRTARSPQPNEIELIGDAAQIAGIAIECHRYEVGLRQSEAYLSESQRLTNTGTWILYPQAPDKVYWTPEHYRIFGFDPTMEPPTRTQAMGRIHPDDKANVDRILEDAIVSKKAFDTHFRIVLPDGTLKHIHGVGHPMLDDAGNVIEVIGTSMDVTKAYESKVAIERSLEENKALKDKLYQENLVLKEELDQASMFEEIVGSSKPLHKILIQVAKVAPTDSTVLIQGETGTGKELIARAIHKRSRRSAGPFISVNCSAIPQSLISSELFGHERGAFTGALERRIGRFEAAHRGTLFLDEVGELPMETQLSLLRVLQERELERVGSSQPIPIDVRVVAATNRNLEAAVAEGVFREDLFYRLNVFPIQMPTLRERADDIPVLVEYLIERYARKAGKKFDNIRKKTLEQFQTYHWPGNIRELQNVIERGVVLSDGGTFSVEETWLKRQSASSAYLAVSLNDKLVEREKEMIEAALRESNGQISGPSGAAAKLGIPRQTLDSRILSLKIDKRQFKKPKT